MKKDKGTLKSKDLFKKMEKAQIVTIVSLGGVMAAAFTALVGMGITHYRIDNFKKEIVSSPAYVEYVNHETEKYNQQLEEGEISQDQYDNYINKIDAGTFLESEFATAAQRAVKEYNDKMAKSFAIVGGTLGGAGALVGFGGILASNHYECKAKQKNFDEGYEALGAENQG